MKLLFLLSAGHYRLFRSTKFEFNFLLGINQYQDLQFKIFDVKWFILAFEDVSPMFFRYFLGSVHL